MSFHANNETTKMHSSIITPNTNNSDNEEYVPCKLEELDDTFTQEACLGHGVSATVFSALKKSGRRVVLKIAMRDQDESLRRELAALNVLNKKDRRNRDLRVIYLEQPILGAQDNLKGLVLQYVQGGTLAQEIDSKANFTQYGTKYGNVYTERRIAWYAWQLADALAFCHERKVYHSDVKSANVLVDRKNGNKLILCDFGSAIGINEEPVGFTEIYAAPELLQGYNHDDLSGLDPEKIDAFGLGCILFELLCCQKLVNLTHNETLAEFIANHQGGCFLDLPCVKLPWMDPSSVGTQTGYSNSLKQLVESLLQPNPQNRWTPARMEVPLREDPRSPLISDYVLASQPAIPGAPVTVDNVQLGMFVQRGPHWADGDLDGGAGTIGTVVQLEPDASFCFVAWPAPQNKEPMFCRIGAQDKYELQIGPTQVRDFVQETERLQLLGLVNAIDENIDILRKFGVVENIVTDTVSVGQMINQFCMVVALRADRRMAFVAPTDRLMVPSIPGTPISPPFHPSNATHRKPASPPSTWQGHSALVEVADVDERRSILDHFYSTDGGLDISQFEITSIKRIQSAPLWEAFAHRQSEIALENWGMPNESDIFHGTGQVNPESITQGLAVMESAFRHGLGNFDHGPALRAIFDNATILKGTKAASATSNAYAVSLVAGRLFGVGFYSVELLAIGNGKPRKQSLLCTAIVGETIWLC